ncbi:MAG: hypothetical protein A2268_13665 [Candidatus Raymondbacteria bacterium RifOxyA12_full_50_37]|uniref:Rhamnulokinase n=1 Tax=Candidatus Raymondbacteria bacterium RIFOXYD12_FULL_49_13 TaxID=1817890 RepID=A0A1F7F0L5_UNCRA|nr:MAG: hypothetical protein A2248_22840 [Candidatus Raymondbacteria bacterium RIFOXYA2_FULL_49_16]OGJ88409.1 MAG: hypothetical protein A2350_14440 [Candidatus Raymondbacteria bacterium RifOxyB12_full_50_8]OGJ91860.1 MAG: hypothetical protein A2268_13665 [Candidatus Raymondbacteria bacterium RifOxyA12_full_50_37]OGK00103.1 MAG: hypothetical protein A2519_12830 [Candidatus Raymondbacteria bacterium RIFOXYD12_FULL_49_13]OGK06949.1 MAG: hypothetical protein A2487_11135 [Candidatus Raymondbacteria 
MPTHHYLAFDLGASSGRAMLGTLKNGKLSIRELHRFENRMSFLFGHYYWNIVHLLDEIKKGLRKCALICPVPDAIGVDTWGVDYALITKDGSLSGLPYAYRDNRTHRTIPKLLKKISKRDIFNRTGLQHLYFNTIFQIHSAVSDTAAELAAADAFFMIPDLINYYLTGRKFNEFTDASTSALVHPATRNWDATLIKTTGAKRSLFQKIVMPGTKIGVLQNHLAAETGMSRVPVLATASHDTAAAVASIPAEGKEWAFISSGTWSIMGIEVPDAIINDRAFRYNFSNEGGINNTYRFLKNITGMWIVQQCREKWRHEARGTRREESDISFSHLTGMAQQATPFKSYINPDDPLFANPQDMPKAIKTYCKNTRQNVPSTPGAIIRCVLESLAFTYRTTLDQLREVSPHQIKTLHIIGGGTKNRLLCQMAADACGIPVVTGPVEGTAMGNLLVQAWGLGHLKDVQNIRQVVRASEKIERYAPQDTSTWEKEYTRYRTIVQKRRNA